MFTKEKAIEQIAIDLFDNPVDAHILMDMMDPMEIAHRWLEKVNTKGTAIPQPMVNAYLYIIQDRRNDFFRDAPPDDVAIILKVVRDLDKESTEIISGGCENPEPSEGLYLVE